MVERFFFAWVEDEETTFGVEHEREDEIIESFSMEHSEGDNAKCSIVIKNPRVGLLAPGRKTYAWLSVETDTAVQAIIFGQLDAIPSNIIGERATLLLLARAPDHGAQKQAIAEALKVRPYDPIFIEDALRDDADTVLECRSVLWHIDRFTHVVSVSDVLIGEDGVEEFNEDDVPYESVQIVPAQTPLRSVHVDASVKWTQTGSGLLEVLNRTFSTYTGDGFLSDWPQVGAKLEGGYTVAEGTRAVDLNGISLSETENYKFSFKNQRKKHVTGDTMSLDVDWSKPSYAGPVNVAFKHPRTVESQNGFLDPFADPQINIPMKIAATYAYIPIWQIRGTLVFGYEVALARTERLKFTLTSDLQRISTSPGEGESEILPINGVDIGLPMLNVLNWTSVAGEAVALGQLIKSSLDDGTVVYLIATQAGTAGEVEPEFSDVLGDTVVDGPTSGPVIWTSLGTTLFTANVPGWVPNDATPLGQLILPEGTSSYQICTDPGTTGATQPTFNAGAGVITADNTVGWTSLGPNGAFLGPPIEDTTRGVFFPTDRGLRAVEYLISVARAHQYFRARAVNVTFECRFERALALSCRKNARLYDDRLPGGVALGKIISYSIKADGPAGKLIGSVTMGCAIGYGGLVAASAGEPTYAEVDTLLPEVQQFTGTIYALPSDDIAYSRPVDEDSPDDLRFPLTREQIVVREELFGSTAGQLGALMAAMPPTDTNPSGGVVVNGGDGYQVSESLTTTREHATSAMRAAAQAALEVNQVYYELELRPLVGGPFNSRYDLEVSDMVVPMMIDLEAESTSP